MPRVLGTLPSQLPEWDDHPYRTGAWTPNQTEFDVPELEVIGELPADLNGVYLRNTENPVFPAIERYHPFDGDGMLHGVVFEGGGASYRNRFIRTQGLEAELASGRPLWAGILEHPGTSERDGWGSRRRMKDASSTDVVVHGGRALTTFYQCGDVYGQDPRSLEQLGPETWPGEMAGNWGVSAHPKADELTGELLFFSYSKQAPYLRYGVVDKHHQLVHHTDVELPGPRLPHDMAFTENYVVFNDFPLFWDAKLLERGIHAPRLHPDLPSRFGVLPRRASGDQVVWFEAAPTYALHFANAYEDGDEIVLEGYPQQNPAPGRQPDDGPYSMLMRYVDLDTLGTHLWRWRFNLKTGATREEQLSECITEFPTINNQRGGRPYRYIYAMTTKPGWFLFDGLTKFDRETGQEQVYRFPENVYASETPMAPRTASGELDEDDGYLTTFVTDLNADRSECQVFSARDITLGPIARLPLPHRISSGTHATWAPASRL